MSHQLSPAAESLRQEIKVLITEATPGKPEPDENATNFYEQDANGNKAYGGSLLGRKVSQLVEKMELGNVRMSYNLYMFSTHEVLGLGVELGILFATEAHQKQVLAHVACAFI